MIVPAGAVIRLVLPLSHIHMRKGYVGCYLYNDNLVQIDVISTVRGRMKSIDLNLTTKSESRLQNTNDA